MRPVYQIYVEEQLIDIDPKTVIAITLQAADFANGDLINRKASFTNQIKVPATQTNIRIFQYANNPKSGSTFPFSKKSVKILANGIQILDGIVFIKSFDTFFNLQFYSIPLDLSYQISNKYLSDLDFGDSNITWDAAFIDSKRASTSGWCAPVVDYGQISINVAAPASIGAYYLPSIAYKDIITKIFSNAGYTISGSLYSSDQLFNNMVLLYSKDSFVSTTIKMKDVMPTDILQIDVIRDFLIKFNSFLRIKNFNVEIVTYNEILNNTYNSIDWTLKRVKNKKDIVSYNLGFAQNNNFEYKKPDNIIDGSIWDIPNGNLSLNNFQAPVSNTIYTSIFDGSNLVQTASPGSPFLGIEQVNGTGGVYYCCTSEIWKSIPTSYIFDSLPKPILAVLDNYDSTYETAIKYNGISRTDYKIARFNPNVVLSNPPQALAWKQLISGPRTTSKGLLNYYYNGLQNLFSSGLIATTHEYYLNDIDINSVDFLTPIFDDGNYYLINKIVNYVSGRTTRVELLKI